MARRETGIQAGPVTLLQLFKGEREYVSPLFQRQYVWGNKEIDALWEGIDAILDTSEAERFLGALVLEVRAAGLAFQPDASWIVDGQQRLTTLYMTLLSIAKLCASSGAHDLAESIFKQYIFNQDGAYKNKPKLQPTLVDFSQFNSTFSDITNPQPKLPPDFGDSAGDLTKAFKRIERAVKDRCFVDNKFSEEKIKTLVAALLEKLAFVQIVLSEEHDAHQVFDSLNSQGIRLENKDLIRNIVFQKLSDNPQQAQTLYQQKWIPLEQSLGDRFDGYFFPFALIHKPQATKSALLATLKDKWKSTPAFEVIEARSWGDYPSAQAAAQPAGLLTPRCQQGARTMKVLFNPPWKHP